MKCTLRLALLFICGSPVLSDSVREHPIAEVITMLETKKSEVVAEGKAEEITYAKYEQWCTESKETLSGTTSDQKAAIATLDDEISAKKTEEASLEKEIAQLGTDIAALTARGVKADSMRNAEAAAYALTQTSIDDTISALTIAIGKMENASSEYGFVQTDAKNLMASLRTKLNHDQLNRLSAVLKEDPVQVYKYKGGEVTQLLRQLKIKFQSDKQDSTDGETNALNAYNLAKQSREASIDLMTETKGDKTTLLGTVSGELVDKGSEKTNLESDLAADAKTLEDTKKQCEMKATQWAERSKIRTTEVAALSAAVRILTKVTGVRSVKPDNPAITSFLQLGAQQEDSPRRIPSSVLQRVVSILRLEAKHGHKVFEALSNKIMSTGVFDEVIGIIRQMIWRLNTEATEEVEHKAWCDKELSKTEIILEKKTEKETELGTALEAAEAKLQLLAQAIADAQKKISDTTAAVEEAKEVRIAGKRENELAMKDAKDAQKALASAVAIIQSFYKESGGMFLQAPVELPDNPDTWDSSYTGATSGPSGVIAALEETSAEFAKMEAETRAQDLIDQTAIDKIISDAKVENARSATEIKYKTEEKGRLTEEISDLTAQKQTATKEKISAERYKADLQPACLSGNSSIAERTVARNEEIAALKSAESILKTAFTNGTVAALAMETKVVQHSKPKPPMTEHEKFAVRWRKMADAILGPRSTRREVSGVGHLQP